MKAKGKVQIVADFLMVVFLPVLMAYSLIGEELHEWLGIIMSLLFAGHHAMNWHWHRNFLKGQYTGKRILGTIVNLVLTVTMVALPVSGIVMARHTFQFIQISGASIARTVHMLASYWGFIFMSLHLGLHWNMIMGIMRRTAHITNRSELRTWGMRIGSILISIYGIYAFFKRQLIHYIFLRSEFVFFDFREPIILFLMDYFAIMALFACIGHYAGKLMENNQKRIQGQAERRD